MGASILAAFTEVESGKRADRPQLAKALAQAKRAKASLVIAKLDRLARNVAFLSALMESGVEFIACDNLNANRLTIHILAAVAEDEARRISQRTQAALTAAKARGTLLGSRRPGHWTGREQDRLHGLAKGRERSAAVRAEKAREAIADLLPEMQRRRREGQSYAAIAAALNQAGQRTVRGGQWNAIQVQRTLDRAAASD